MFSCPPVGSSTAGSLDHLAAVHHDGPDYEDVDGDHHHRPDRVGAQEADVEHHADHREDDGQDAAPHLAAEERDRTEQHDDAAQHVHPAPGGVVDRDRESALAHQEDLIPEDRDQSFDDVEDAAHEHHPPGKGDPADPAGGGRGVDGSARTTGSAHL